ncbi:MAG TPA: PAS domain S-box protein, partial [Leptolyngbyaceae cyanobacterium M33_DOE_097]|nr:PAS domain S-box protein [Leptolyngbyaceae cyanobacterium M33_DOE_097]
MSTHWTVLVIADPTDGDRTYELQLKQDSNIAYHILTESLNTAALALFQSQQVDGILLKPYFPYTDSVSLLRQLKELLGDRCPPIVVIDSDNAELAVQALKNGAADYLVKDRITPDDLRSAMRSAIDNTDFRKASQRSQEQFQALVENMLDCFGSFSAIRNEAGQIVDFRIDYLNESACANNRMPKDQQIGRNLCELLPDHRDSGLFDEYCRVVETAEPLVKDAFVYPGTDSEQHLIRAFDIRASKLNDGFVASWRDVSDRRRMELELNHTITELQRQEAEIQQLNRDLTNRVDELQSLFDIIPVGVAIATDPSCAEMQHNAYLRELLGVDSGHNISKSAPASEQPPYRVLQNGQEIPVENLPMQVAARTGIEVRDAEFDILLPDGTIRQLLSYARPLHDQQNQVRGVIGAFLDITKRNQDAAALKASQQRYRELAEAMPQMVWMADASGAVHYWNQRWYEYTGLSEAESLGMAGANTVHPDDRDRTLTQWGEAIANRTSFEIEYRIRNHEGEYHWFICRAVSTHDPQNQITGWIGTLTNIDTMKRSEALVQQSEQQLQRQLAEIEAIYQSAPIGLNVLDSDLRFVRINQRLADINGLPIEAHIGHTVQELFPDLADTLERLLQPILKTGEPLLNVEIRGETPAQPGVQRIWLEHFLPLKAGDQVVGISTVCEEITERIQMEAALRASEERFRQMADNAPVMIWVTDPDGYCTYLNRGWCDFTGQTETTGLGFGWLDAVHLEDSESSRNSFLSAVQRQESLRLEYRLRRKDGEYRWVIDAASPWFGDEGELKGFIGSVIDISDRKQAEQDLMVKDARLRARVNAHDSSWFGISLSIIGQDPTQILVIPSRSHSLCPSACLERFLLV